MSELSALTPKQFWEVLVERMAQTPKAVALVSGDQQLSFSDLIDQVERLKQKSSPLTAQRRIVSIEDPLQTILEIMSCWAAGGVPSVITDGSGFTTQPADPREALIVKTSGTTGRGKHLALPASSLLINAKTIATDLGFCRSDKILMAMPMTYLYGLVGSLIAGLWAGAEIHLFPAQTVPSILQAYIRKAAITVVQGPPSTHRLHGFYWNKVPFDGVRLVSFGGEACDQMMLEGISNAYPQARKVQVYGMSEAGPRISHLDLKTPEFKPGRIGLPFDHINWRIVPVAGNEQSGYGRLAIAGASVMLGYLDGQGGYHGVGEDGYFVSNDLVSQDIGGSLNFIGRFDRCFKSGGQLVNPGHIEQALKSLPGVVEAKCVAVPHEILGQVPIAQILRTEQNSLSAGDIIAASEPLLEAFEIPRSIEFVKNFALNASGKRA